MRQFPFGVPILQIPKVQISRGGMMMNVKKSILFYFLLCIVILGLINISSCKRSKVTNPDVTGRAGFRIILSGVANPSTLYVPQSLPAVSSLITATALNNDGTPVANHRIIFQTELYGYFENYQISDTRMTNSSGVAQITFFIPPGSNIAASVLTNIYATLVDDGRLDNTTAQVQDTIPIIIHPYLQSGLIIHGHIRTPDGNGVGEVAVDMTGDGGNISAVTTTRPSGSYEFYVPGGWYGIIKPDATGYTFVPTQRTYSSLNPVSTDLWNEDFVAMFVSGNTLTADVTQWSVPAAGGTQVVNVTNATGDAAISYTITPDSPWITVSPSSGVTPGSFVITVEENLTGDTRSGSITIVANDTESSDVVINIDQDGTDVSGDAVLTVDRQTINIDGAGGTETINVYNSGSSESIDYIVTSNDSWLTPSTTSGSTDDTLDITIDPNTDVARTGTVTLTATSTGVQNPTITITVNQEAGASIAVSPASYNATSAAGETFTVTVTNPTNSDVLTWTAANADSWISVVPDTGDTNNGTFTVTIQSANPTSNVRTGTITLTASNGATAEVKVYQAGS
jgi:hypothetical protein